MCLLAVCETQTIPEVNFREAFRCNNDGFGFAFRDKGKVAYFKGMMDADEAWRVYKEFKKERIFPHVIHFRLGKPTINLLTHPFEITEESELKLNNVTKDNLLFHNGVISCWKDRMFETFAKLGKIPDGPLMDTRVAAIMCALYGKRIFEFIDGKFVIFGPDTLDMIGVFEEDKGVKYSNLSYKVSTFQRYTERENYNAYRYPGKDLWTKDEIDEFIV